MTIKLQIKAGETVVGDTTIEITGIDGLEGQINATAQLNATRLAEVIAYEFNRDPMLRRRVGTVDTTDFRG